MRVYLYTSDSKINETAANIGLFSFCDSLYENSYHSIISFVLIGAYIFKMLTKQSSQFKSFLPFHIVMYISMICLFILILHSKYHLGLFFNIFIAVISFQPYMIHAFNCLNLSITIFDLGPTVNTKKLRIILMVTGLLLRIALLKVKLVVEISEKRIYTMFIENILCIVNLFLVCLLVLNKKISNQNKFGIAVHSALSSASFMLFQFIDGTVVFYMNRPWKLYNFDIFVFSAYYFVFFWIISAYITNFKVMKKYFDRDTIGNAYVELGKLDDSAKEKF